MPKYNIKITPENRSKKSTTLYPVISSLRLREYEVVPPDISPKILLKVATKFLEKPCKNALNFFKIPPAIALIIFLFSVTGHSSESKRIRRVSYRNDDVVTVKTSLGIATIIQVPDRPNSVVVGDQDSFKVEYLDQAITIKPLSGGAKSNLYIYTDWRRFNVALISGSEAVADYVVYLDIPNEKPQTTSSKDSGIRWTDFKNSLKSETISLNVKRVGKTKEGILLVEFLVSSTTKEAFKPEWLWITQSGEMRPIHNLFMSALEVTPQKTISGVLQMREIDLNTNEPIRIELRRKKTSYLTIQKVTSWKR